jgi:hypothetical protein
MPAEQRAKIAATLRGRAPGEATRVAVSRRHRGVQKSDTQKARTSASLMGHSVSAETRAKIGASLTGRRPSSGHLARQQAGLERWRAAGGRVWRSKLEIRAGALLPGFEPQVYIGRHAFDYGSPDRLTLVEVNGCFWHDHRSVDPTCPYRGRAGAIERNGRTRVVALNAGARLIELWECQEALWPRQLAAQQVYQ